MPRCRIGKPDDVPLIAQEFGRGDSHDQEIKRFSRLLAYRVPAAEGEPSISQMNQSCGEVAFHDKSPKRAA
jgi:hypothetical protein